MIEEELPKKTSQTALIQDLVENDPALEMKNIPGFDVLDTLPEEQKLKSYNDEFYSTLSNMNFLVLLFLKMTNYFIILKKITMLQ